MMSLCRLGIVLSVWLVVTTHSALAQNQQADVEVMVVGRLEVWKDNDNICTLARGEAVIDFHVESQNMSFEGRTTTFDEACFWRGTGTLHSGQDATLHIVATYRDYVPIPQRRKVEIQRSNRSQNQISVRPIVSLYNQSRAVAELRALGNESNVAGNPVLAIAFYDDALAVAPDLDTLFLKADSYDHIGHYSEAAAVWEDAFHIVSEAEASVGPRRDDVAWRWTNSLYEAAQTYDQPDTATWLELAAVCERSLRQSTNAKHRPRIMGVWLDVLFRAAGTHGDYRTLAEAIASDPAIGSSWSFLFYREFEGETPREASDLEDIVRGIAALEQGLGRKE